MPNEAVVVTLRERQVLILRSQGRGISDIAAMLGISGDAAHDFLSSVIAKAGANSDINALRNLLVQGAITVRDLRGTWHERPDDGAQGTMASAV